MEVDFRNGGMTARTKAVLSGRQGKESKKKDVPVFS